MSDPFYIDLASHSLNKQGEELCGDHVEIIKTDQRLIVVLADGLGSGVKANILATITSKIMSTMLQKGADLLETIDTITHTLPVCSVRKIGYSTFSIIEVDHNGLARIIEFDNPPVFFIRKHKILPLEKEKMRSAEKDVWISKIQLQVGDEVVLCSDGVIHAGVGNLLNHGWEWHHVADFLQSQRLASADKLNRRLLETCQKLYENKPGDDTTAVTLKIRKPEWVQVFTGPPDTPTKDKAAVQAFYEQTGRKIVCGGTAANIVSRELNREIITSLDYVDPFVPPTAEIKGIDLVTEGVLTLKMALTQLKRLNGEIQEPFFNKEDGVSRLLKLLIEDCTHIQFWLGRAINPAHQNPDFPKDLSIKSRVIQEIIDELKKLGKDVRLSFTD